MEQGKRLLYIDVLRGFCILVVVMQHVGLNIPVPGLFVLDTAVACFYFVSGFFFEKSVSKCDGTLSFLKKKCLTLLVPFTLWYLLSYIMFYSLKIAVPFLSLGSVEYHGVEYLFFQRPLFNGPIWFVLSLFYVEVLYWFIRRLNSERLRFLVVVLLSGGGYLLYKYQIVIYASIDGVMMALLFLYAGTVSDKMRLENRLQSMPWWVETVLVVILYLIYFLFRPFVVFRDNSFPSGYLPSVVGLLSIVLCIYINSHLLFKRIDLPPRIFPWFGVNSLVVLCSHHLIYRPIEYGLGSVGVHSSLIVFAFTLIFTAVVVLICSKYIPILAGKSRFKNNK